jgi:hypothetical protein
LSHLQTIAIIFTGYKTNLLTAILAGLYGGNVTNSSAWGMKCLILENIELVNCLLYDVYLQV